MSTMSSRCEKQAELRRRMAETRSKLSLLAEESPNRDDSVSSSPQQQQLVEAAMATSAASSASSERGEKRPLFPAPRGGILRKPKYSNNTSSMSDDHALATTPSATALKSMTTATESNNNAQNKLLGELMADYGDSSSDNDDDNHDDSKSNNNNNNNSDEGEYDAALSSSSTENGYASRETQINPPRSKRKDTKSSTLSGETETENDTPSSHVTEVTSTVDDTNSGKKKKKKKKRSIAAVSEAPESEISIKVTDVGPTPSIQEKSTQLPMISDEVWDEFNALLEEGDTEASNNNTTTDEGNISSMSEGSTAVTDVESSTIPSTEKISKKMKKKKKKDSTLTSKRDMYDNDAAINFEQASYEARLARLMLLKSKKALHRNHDSVAASSSGDGVEDTMLLKSANEFYDPGLAFQEEGGEGNEDAHYDNDSHGGSSMMENPTSSRSGIKPLETTTTTTATATSTAPPSQKMTASITAPLSLAKILRDRRDEARKLSSRGANRNGSGEGGSEITSLDDEDDGQWF